MSASVGTRLALLEEQIAQLRKRVSQTPEQEVAWRMFASEREIRIKADVDAALAKEALVDQQRTLEDVMSELEGLSLFLSRKLPMSHPLDQQPKGDGDVWWPRSR